MTPEWFIIGWQIITCSLCGLMVVGIIKGFGSRKIFKDGGVELLITSTIGTVMISMVVYSKEFNVLLGNTELYAPLYIVRTFLPYVIFALFTPNMRYLFSEDNSDRNGAINIAKRGLGQASKSGAFVIMPRTMRRTL